MEFCQFLLVYSIIFVLYTQSLGLWELRLMIHFSVESFIKIKAFFISLDILPWVLLFHTEGEQSLPPQNMPKGSLDGGCAPWRELSQITVDWYELVCDREEPSKAQLFKVFSVSHFFFLRFDLFIFREGKGGRKRGRETSMCGCLLHAPYWGPGPGGLCPNWESN